MALQGPDACDACEGGAREALSARPTAEWDMGYGRLPFVSSAARELTECVLSHSKFSKPQ